MKALISMVTLALALAVTGPAFAAAGDLKGATNQADCEKAGGVQHLQVLREEVESAVFSERHKGARFGGRSLLKEKPLGGVGPGASRSSASHARFARMAWLQLRA